MFNSNRSNYNDLRRSISAILSEQSTDSISTVDWEALLHYSSQCLITPSLYLALIEKDAFASLEDEVQEVLLEIYQANKIRNELVLDSFVSLCDVLNKADIVPIPLKGVGLLAQGVFEDIGERVLTDIDLLIEPSELSRALEALGDAGYLQITNMVDPISLDCPYQFDEIDINDFRNQLSNIKTHIPYITSIKHQVTIEIHIRVCAQKDEFSSVLNELVWKETTVEKYQHATYRNPSTFFHIIHNFYHSQISHSYCDLLIVDIRHLIDIKRLVLYNNARNEYSSSTEKCIERCLQFVNDHDLSGCFYSYFWQLEKYCGLNTYSSYIESEASKREVDKFVSAQNSGVKCVWRKFSVWAKYKIGIHFSYKPKGLRYGPIPVPQRLYKYLRFIIFRLMRPISKKFRNRDGVLP